MGRACYKKAEDAMQEAQEFVEEIMGLAWPLANLPTASQAQKAFKDKIPNSDAGTTHRAFLAKLQASTLEILWPDQDFPELTIVGVLFAAAKKLNPKKKKGGHRAGAKNWSQEETTELLDLTEQVKPCGCQQWETVAAGLVLAGFGWNNRDGDACKLKFEKMCFAPKPTGQTEVPRHILRAMQIKEKICVEEVIGHSLLNDKDDEDESPSDPLSDSSTDKGKKGTRLFSPDGEQRRPVTKKRKIANVAEALESISAQQVESSSMLAGAIQQMASKLGDSSSTSEAIAKMDEKYNKMNEKLDKLVELLTKKSN